MEKLHWEYYDTKYGKWMNLWTDNYITGIKENFSEDEAIKIFKDYASYMLEHHGRKLVKLRRKE